MSRKIQEVFTIDWSKYENFVFLFSDRIVYYIRINLFVNTSGTSWRDQSSNLHQFQFTLAVRANNTYDETARINHNKFPRGISSSYSVQGTMDFARRRKRHFREWLAFDVFLALIWLAATIAHDCTYIFCLLLNRSIVFSCPLSIRKNSTPPVLLVLYYLIPRNYTRALLPFHMITQRIAAIYANNHRFVLRAISSSLFT